MRRYRNIRYAPESLEHKLSPSTMAISPAPAQYGTMSTDPGPSNYYSGDYLATDGDGDGDDDGDVPPNPDGGPAPHAPSPNPSGPVLPG